jgi:hypothetical protein
MKVIADTPCVSCGGALVLPTIAYGFVMPIDTDYVCLKCGAAYRWVGRPARLKPWAAAKGPTHVPERRRLPQGEN